jgi:hypothetical protein
MMARVTYIPNAASTSYIVVRQSVPVLEIQVLARIDQALLIRRNAFLVLDLLLDVLDGVCS